MAGVLGIEPRLTDLESVVLPLNYTPILKNPSPLIGKPVVAYADRLLLGKRFFSGFVLYW